MKKLTINMLHMTNQPQGQGVSSATKEQINLLKEMTQDVFIITENSKKDGDINHFHQIDPFMYLRIKNSDTISVMHVHFLPETLEGSIKFPKPIMEMFKMYFLDFYKSADYLVVVNPIFIEPLTTFGITPDRIKYIPNYVSKKDFYKLPESEILATKEEFNLDPHKFTVLGVGQVQTRKGVLDFVEVAKRLPDLQFVWAGGFSFGAITDGYKELKEVVENPPSNVTFTNIIPREQMNHMFNMADCLFMPSYNELFPMAILEASNVEVPMVLRDLDLYEDILFHKYFKGSNNDEFVDLLSKLSSDPDMFKQAQEYSKYISDYYSKENVSAQWVEFYQQIYKTHQDSHKLSINADEFERIKQKQQTAIINSSIIDPFPLKDVVVGDRLILKKGLLPTRNKIIARAKEVIVHNKTKTSEGINIITEYQDKLKIDQSEIKKHASKAYFSIIEIDNIHIYEKNVMSD